MLKRGDGSIEQLGVTGALLGAMEGAFYDEFEVTLSPGDVVLLYTDGVTEARRGNIFFGDDRVVSVLKAGKGPADIARMLLDEVRDYVQGELRDDVAVLVVVPRGETDRRQDEIGGE
jgi:serine phosphatase RsbU (regulator of sigma subunit)